MSRVCGAVAEMPVSWGPMGICMKSIFSRKAAVQSQSRAYGLYSWVSEFPRATRKHLWILCPNLEAIPLGFSVSSRLMSDSHSWLLPLFMALLSSEKVFTGTHISDLTLFLINEEWKKATGQCPREFHCKKWRLWILKVVSHMVCTTLLAYVQPWGAHSLKELPLPMLGGSSQESSFLLNWHPCLGLLFNKQMRAALKVQFVETSQQKLLFLLLWHK